MLILFYLLACVKGNGKLLSVIKSVNSGKAHLEKAYFYKAHYWKGKKHKTISQRTHKGEHLSAVEPNLILLIKTLPYCAIKLVCLQEFLDHFPPLNTCTQTKKSTVLSLKKFALLVKKPFYEWTICLYYQQPKNNREYDHCPQPP